jgi:acyl transferase domain-containing protein
LFDNSFFSISNIEAKAIDPQHRMMLEVAYEAFEDAGLRMEDLAGSETAVFCAISNHDYDKILSRDAEMSPGYEYIRHSLMLTLTGIGIASQEQYINRKVF